MRLLISFPRLDQGGDDEAGADFPRTAAGLRHRGVDGVGTGIGQFDGGRLGFHFAGTCADETVADVDGFAALDREQLSEAEGDGTDVQTLLGSKLDRFQTADDLIAVTGELDGVVGGGIDGDSLTDVRSGDAGRKVEGQHAVFEVIPIQSDGEHCVRFLRLTIDPEGIERRRARGTFHDCISRHGLPCVRHEVHEVGAGRFDRQIYVDLPDLREREEIFKVHLRPLKVDTKLDTSFLAKQTPGFSGADIANVCNESALIAARKNKKKVNRQDFLDAVDRIIGGLEKKNKIITPSEKKTIAFHEAGHATVSWMLKHAAPLVKVTIVPRGQSLGAAWYLPEERQIVRTEQMLDEMCATLGGRAAEQIIFGKISTGALSDLVKVTRQARAMVTVYGLNDKIGNITYYDNNGQSEFGFTKPYSEETAKQIDEEISKIVEREYKRALSLLRKHKKKLSELAEHLLEKEVIFKDDLVSIFGKRPFEKEETVEEKAKTSPTKKAVKSA